MPTSRVISRIQAIENRIQEIQKMGQVKQNTPKTTENTGSTDGSRFSDMLNEVMLQQTNSQIDLMSDNISADTLLNSRTDTLMELYKQSGEMPVSKPKTLPQNYTGSANPKTWDDAITHTAKTVGVDEHLIHAVIHTESAYNPNAVSRAGAEGLMQLMPATAESLGVKDSFNPEQNIWGGASYLKQMLDRYNGDLIKALAAYNAGPEAVDRHNGIPNYKETQAYVPKVLNYYYNLKNR